MTDTIRIASADDVPAVYALLQDAYAPLAAQGVHFTITRSPIERVAQAVAREATFVLEHAAPDGHTALAATLTVRFPWVSGERHRTPYPFLHWFAVAPAFTRQAGHTLLEHVETVPGRAGQGARDVSRDRDPPSMAAVVLRARRLRAVRSLDQRARHAARLAQKILIPDLYEDPATADAPPERLPVPVNA